MNDLGPAVKKAPKYVVAQVLREQIEQAIARGEDEDMITDRLVTDLFTVRRVRAGMDEAARPGSGTRCDPFGQQRQRQLDAEVRRREQERRRRERST